MSGNGFRAVLFDMDGTLVDTLPDIAAAVNDALVELGLHALDQAQIATLIGNGPRVLARRALEAQQTLSTKERDRLVEPLVAGYARKYVIQAGTLGRLFPGTVEGLRELTERGLKLAVVTNALQHLAETVLTRFGIASYLQLIIGGDRVSQPKPHPAPLWHACDHFGVDPQQALMVGDSVNDVAAARAAGCAIVCVPHGYDQGQPVSELGCDVLGSLAALPAWVDARESEDSRAP